MEDTPHQHNPQQPLNPVLAVSDLEEQNSKSKRLLLTAQSLQVYYRGKGRAFSLEYLERLSLEHRKLWLPLIGGGILASLCLLALLHTFNMPYRLLAGAVIGAFGIWWGYRGSTALVVYEQRHHTDFLLRQPAGSLPLFIAFANRIIRRYPQPLGEFCIRLSSQEWQQLSESGTLHLDKARRCEPPEIAVRQNPGTEEGHWFAFDPYSMGPRLQWSLNGQELVAHLQGSLSMQEVRLLL